jgi:putative transposase
MARPLRLSFENAVYHIMARGNRKDAIFHSDRDKDVFVDKMNETFTKYSFVCYSYCLVKNHYHLLLKTPFANISKGMHNLNASYANWFKAKHNIVGVVFQGRFKSIIVDEESYALAASVYIHSNPPERKSLKSLEDYKWSSYPDYVGLRKPVIENLDTTFILGKFHNDQEKAAQMYRKYVLENAGMENPLEDAYKGFVIGSQDFIAKIEQKVREFGEKREIPESKHSRLVSADEIINLLVSITRVDKEEIYKRRRGSTVNHLAIYLMKEKTDLSLKAIGRLFSMDYAAVSIAAKRFKGQLQKDNNARILLAKALRGLEKC